MRDVCGYVDICEDLMDKILDVLEDNSNRYLTWCDIETIMHDLEDDISYEDLKECLYYLEHRGDIVKNRNEYSIR